MPILKQDDSIFYIFAVMSLSSFEVYVREPSHVSCFFSFRRFDFAAKMLGLLRVRSPIFKSFHSLSFRHPALLQQRSLSLLIIQQRPTLFHQQSTRFLSLASILSRPKPTAAPTPLVVAHITRLEAEANVHPHDVSKQLILFEALSNTKLKSSYDLIITRWERMCEFVRFISFLHSGPYSCYPGSLIPSASFSSRFQVLYNMSVDDQPTIFH